MAIEDTASGYGWLSILLHWVTTIVIVTMLYVGSSIAGLEGEERSATLVSHTSIGVTAYVVLWLRIVWRIVQRHPGPLPAQGRIFPLIGRCVHWVLLAALTLQLCTGPLIVWTMDEPIQVFDWFAIPSPLPADMGVSNVMHSLHAAGAIVIFGCILLHLGGTYKHTAFNQDGTLTKIIIPARAAAAPPAGVAPEGRDR